MDIPPAQSVTSEQFCEHRPSPLLVVTIDAAVNAVRFFPQHPISELSMGPFCVTWSNPTHQLTDPTQPNPLQAGKFGPNPTQPNKNWKISTQPNPTHGQLCLILQRAQKLMAVTASVIHCRKPSLTRIMKKNCKRNNRWAVEPNWSGEGVKYSANKCYDELGIADRRIAVSLNAFCGSVAEWLACWTQAQKGPSSNRSRDAVG